MREVHKKKKKIEPYWEHTLGWYPGGHSKKNSLNQLETVTWVHIVIIQHLFTVC